MRKLIVVISAAALLLAAGSSASAGLIHYWDFEDASAGSTGTLADAGSGPAAPLNTGGTVQQVFSPGYDGLKDITVARYVGYTTGTLTSLPSTFTLETVIQYNGVGSNGWAKLFSDWGGCAFLQMGNNAISWQAGGSNSPTLPAPVGYVTPAFGTWLFVALVADATAGTMTAYEVPMTAGTVAALNSNNTYTGLMTGCGAFSVGNSGKYAGTGNLDYVAIWDTAMTLAELQDHYDNGPPVGGAVPEPASLGLVGVVLLALKRRRS